VTVRDLVERARDGDRDAFAALVETTGDRMYGLAARILRDHDLAEDALPTWPLRHLMALWMFQGGGA
jgi:DNA-directed RNA polymerase specialized sigma24 family protein